ncbi:hypothetical protein GCM10007938_03780 [Vibrio zhanjiangensis]|uniref:Uncharacterized protein n=1 Tax=Vibrio zhanjiangensis TaxID=1046128 RepID=A0ABQ6EVQ1_9VIBR|nr:hypothetical protein [Vibrio zhanjiangensis]GLT16602.1 hypothetical protein GCM10007938_03780 [Vibrio zhanjiangensis]
MMNSIALPGLSQIPDTVKAVLKQFSSYDDPCLVLLHCSATQEVVEATYQQVVETNDCEASKLLCLEQNIRFCHLFCDYRNANFIAHDLTDTLNQQGYAAKISLFRHNCITDVQDTYRWNVTQLLALLESSDPVAINDFCDKHNWQGISQYLEADEVARFEVEERDSEKVVIPAVDQGDNITAPLQELYPFIVNLPKGKMLWHYVLSGELDAKIPLAECLLDLDSVLITRHAKRYSPNFYRHIIRKCNHDTVPPQHNILRNLDEVLEPLHQVLLSEPHHRQNQEQFLRVVDIFFHLLDQQDLPKTLNQILVKDKETACISSFEFERRYTLPSETLDNNICPKTKRKINQIIDSLDLFYTSDYEDYQEIEQVFSTSRHTFNYQLWLRDDEEQQILCRLVGAILLNIDYSAGHFDHYTEALQKWVSHGLYRDVFKQITENCDAPQELLRMWLLEGKQACFTALVDELSSKLDGDYTAYHNADIGVTQQQYSLFDSTSIFGPILATCYWFYKVSQDDFAKRVILLSMALAPQATLTYMSGLYRESFRGFVAPAIKNAFVMPLYDMGVSYIDLCAFDINIAVENDEMELEPLVQRYAGLDQDEREIWNLAINKLSSYSRDYFYLNVNRLHPQLKTPLREFRSIVVNEIMSCVANEDKNVDIGTCRKFALRFLDGEMSFNQYQSFVHDYVDVSKFDLPPDYYRDKAPKILPQILTEPDIATQLRWVQLFCCEATPNNLGWIKSFRRHSIHNEKLQNILLEHLFFEQLVHEKSLSFCDRQTIELSDLAPDWLEYWREYQKHMTRKIKSL